MEPTRVFSVLTINIWNRQGPWDERRELLRSGIEALNPDLIGLQEVMRGPHPDTGRIHCLTDELLGGTGYQVVFGVAKPLSGDVCFGNAAASRWPIEVEEVVPLGAAGTSEQRCLLMTRVAAPFGALPFLVTHLAWRLHHGFVRERQVLDLARAIEQRLPLDDGGLPPVLVGDFNAAPDATEIRFLKGLHALDGQSTYFGDAFELAGDGPGVTFDARRNPFAAPTHEPPRRIDYIFVRGPDDSGRGLVRQARVVLDEEVGGVTPSDHYGVFAEIGV